MLRGRPWGKIVGVVALGAILVNLAVVVVNWRLPGAATAAAPRRAAAVAAPGSPAEEPMVVPAPPSNPLMPPAAEPPAPVPPLPAAAPVALAVPTSPAAHPALPPRASLPGPMPFMWQSLNNCGPCSVAMAVGYYGVPADQQEVEREIEDNPNRLIPTSVLARSGSFAHMTAPWDLTGPIRARGLEAKPRWGGDLDRLRSLLAAGVPVIVFQWLEPGATVRHFRVARGYDDERQVIYTNDSYLGQNRPISYAEFMDTWRFSNRWYMPVYRKADEQAVARALGAEWDDSQMWAGAVARNQAEVAQAPHNAEARWNLGDSLARLEQWGAAAEQWEVAERLPRPTGLTAGQWAARVGSKLANAYVKLGAPQRGLEKADQALASAGENRTPWTMLTIADAWRVKGDAYAALGDAARAGAAYQQALALNPRNNDARKALGLPPAPVFNDH